jgi:gas vesicle protein
MINEFNLSEKRIEFNLNEKEKDGFSEIIRIAKEEEQKRIKEIIDIWVNKLEGIMNYQKGIYDINKSDIEKLKQEIEKTEEKD